jgi:hypothetical protein
MQRVLQVVQHGSRLQKALSSPLGQHNLRYLQQSYVAQGCTRKAHDQTHGHYSVRKVRSDICIKRSATESSQDLKMRKEIDLLDI